MAEYINRDALFKHYRALANIEWNKTVAPISWSDAYEEIADHIAELPPADVVPKSEVEWLYKQVDMLSQEVMYNDDIAKMKVDEAKAEVAREILRRLRKCFINTSVMRLTRFIGLTKQTLPNSKRNT